MDLEHSFTVPVPKERAWTVLLDVERVAPCMPGATLDSADGDVIYGKIKVKVGPISMTYAGTARFTEKNAEAGEVTLEASGKETRGAGTASATVRSVLEDRGSETRVIVYTSLNVTGKPAQFGRGVMAEVGGKLIGIFAANLAEMLTADQSDGAAEAGAEPAGTELAGTEEDPLSLPLEELRLPLRSYNSLRKEGVHTVGDLAARTPQQLLAIENIGPASVDEIRQRLAEHDLTLGEAPAGADAFASANGRSGPPASGTGTFGAAASQTAASDAVAPETAAPETAPPGTSVSGAGAGASGPQPTPQPFAPSRPGDNDAIDLLSVAGVPVLKRAVPALAALIAVALVVLGLRRRRRRRRG
jgi:carbon monoxide dehydrogenase subunit G